MNAIIVPKSIDNAHKEMIWKVSWHPNGYILASCSNDKTVKLWNTKTMELMVKYYNYYFFKVNFR